MNKNIITTIILSSITASSLYAAQVPNIGTIQSEVKQPVVKKEQLELPEINVQEYKAPMKDSEKRMFIKSFQITGALHVKQTELYGLIKEYENQELTFKQIQELTSKITKYYRKEGYFVARAYVPVQEMKEGVLEIAVIEGNYGKFILKNNSHVKDSTVQGMLDYAKRDNIVSTSTLESAMLVINDTPGTVVTQADVMPGSKVGTSDFMITTEPADFYEGYILGDNYGSRYTGVNRILAGLNLNSPFRLGDKLSLTLLKTDAGELENYRAAYSFPIHSSGTRLEFSAEQTTYNLGDNYDALDAIGRSTTVTIRVAQPLRRTRLENISVHIDLAAKKLKDEVRSTSTVTDKKANVITLGVDYDRTLSYGNIALLANYTLGSLKFINSDALVLDKAGANTNGDYSKINIELDHNINLKENLALVSKLQIQQVVGNKNLDGSEDFTVSGSNGVKVYPTGELSAENGYLFGTELFYSLPAYNSQVSVFYDAGSTYMQDTANVSFTRKTLQDVGIGYYVNYRNLFAKAQLAWAVGGNKVTSEPQYARKLLLQAGWSF